jgi:putative PIN family toxin of toxin-antitoxin system
MTGVLARKFNFSPEDINEASRRIMTIARMVTPSVRLDVIKEDPPDNRVLECAVSSGADYLVTGDKDLLRLGRYDSISIITPSGFLDLMSEQFRTP